MVMTMPETVTIKATPTTMKLAKEAMEIQDACNPLAIVRFLELVIHYWTGMADRDQLEKLAQADGQKYVGSDIATQNPITQAVINKLCDLGRMEQTDRPGATSVFIQCLELAEGKDVETPIVFRN